MSLAYILSLLTMVAWIAALGLLYVLPHWLAVYTEMEGPLPGALALAVRARDVLQRSGLLSLPFLIGLTVVSITWHMVARLVRGRRR